MGLGDGLASVRPLALAGDRREVPPEPARVRDRPLRDRPLALASVGPEVPLRRGAGGLCLLCDGPLAPASVIAERSRDWRCDLVTTMFLMLL